MNKKIVLVLMIGIIAAAVTTWYIQSHRYGVDAFSGATPPALERGVPGNLQLQVTGDVKQIYTFDSRALRLLAKTRVRTHEVSPEGEILGAYIYSGIPLLYILEGVTPQKEKNAAFDRPLDMLVTAHTASGKTARFSYGELTMTDDRHPVLLAFHREPLNPTKNPGTYTRNKYTENLRGLRLVCPREPDTTRYLDDVVQLSLSLPPTPGHALPVMKKGEKCSSTRILCLQADGTAADAVYDGVGPLAIDGWLRIGHGRGIKGDSLFQAGGYALRSFLKANFPGCGPGDFFMFVACDGYRGLFSGREIFLTRDGAAMLLIENLNGSPPKNGKTLGVTDDFFVDRNIWGLSHIVHIPE